MSHRQSGGLGGIKVNQHAVRYILDTDGAVLRPPLPGGEDRPVLAIAKTAIPIAGPRLKLSLHSVSMSSFAVIPAGKPAYTGRDPSSWRATTSGSAAPAAGDVVTSPVTPPAMTAIPSRKRTPGTRTCPRDECRPVS